MPSVLPDNSAIRALSDTDVALLARQAEETAGIALRQLEEARPALERAVALFGALGPAFEWLTSPSPAFHGARPLDKLESSEGVDEVVAELGRIEHGVLA